MKFGNDDSGGGEGGCGDEECDMAEWLMKEQMDTQWWLKSFFCKWKVMCTKLAF